MKYLILDTCAIIHIIRGNSKGKSAVEWIETIEPKPIQVISVVTKSELSVFAQMAGWQDKRNNF